MKKHGLYLWIFLLPILLLTSCGVNRSTVTVACPGNATAMEYLAAKEVARYIYLRTGQLPEIIRIDSLAEEPGSLILVAQKNKLELGKIGIEDSILQKAGRLGKEQFWIKSMGKRESKQLLIAGGDEVAVLYGAYRFAELLGIRFYLHGDVVPDEQVAFEMPVIDEHSSPLFELRGIHPFHDFPEGPDWWDRENYKAILAQLPKMGMNFFGLHTYPEYRPNAEPTVWIGEKQDITGNGNVSFSYSSSYQSTHRGNWGYQPKNTGGYHFGASLLFESDSFSASVMKGMIPAPVTPEQYNLLFNKVGDLYRGAFTFAHSLGIKTCVGTETPLIIPDAVRAKFIREHKDPNDPQVIKGLYEGIFERIRQTYPLDYYWLWTPEGWTWEGVTDKDVSKTEQDLFLASEAAKAVKAPFTLATCGWVLGPPRDRAQFDRSLPKQMPFSCINRYVGFAPVESAFAGITDRPTWAIPWLEDDPGLSIPQLWVGRMRRDAADAAKYGCEGLMGIHWRTQILGPNISALAKASWNQEPWNSTIGADSIRDMPTEDFYEDWAASQFGPEIGKKMAVLFIKLDGGPMFRPELKQDYAANLYRAASWIDGPGGIKRNNESWASLEKNFSFISEMEALKGIIRGAGNKERFNYWLENFRYLRDMAHLGCVLGELDRVMKQVNLATINGEKITLVQQKALPLRIQATKLMGEMETALLSVISTTGEIGTITNLEQHNQGSLKLLNSYDSLLVAITHAPLPAESLPWKDYKGRERVFCTTNRSLLQPNESLSLKIIILSKDKPLEAFFYWRPLASQRFSELPLVHVKRGVYRIDLDAGAIGNNDIEYYVEATMPDGKELVYPATAPIINQTVLIYPENLSK